MISQNFEHDLFAVIVFFPFPKSNNYGKSSDDTVNAAEVIPGDSKRNNYGKGSDDAVHDQRSAFASG